MIAALDLEIEANFVDMSFSDDAATAAHHDVAATSSNAAPEDVAVDESGATFNEIGQQFAFSSAFAPALVAALVQHKIVINRSDISTIALEWMLTLPTVDADSVKVCRLHFHSFALML